MSHIDGFLDDDTSDLLTELKQTASIALAETCSCGASYKSVWPETLADMATKQINTWRRFHVCSVRTEDSQPTARQWRQE